MSRPTFRVHFITHHDGMLTGRLLPSSGRVEVVPAGYGRTDDEVLGQIHLAIAERRAEAGTFLWTDALHMRKVKIAVHPQAVVKKRHVIGKQKIELELGYAWAELPRGGFRVIVPRFGWWFVLEDIEMAAPVLKQSVGAYLLGHDARSLYEFRRVEERIEVWDPPLRPDRGGGRTFDSDSPTPTLHAVAELLTTREPRRHRPVVGDFEFEAHLPMVLHEPPRSLLIVGPPGVGKTTWVTALARRLVGMRDEDLATPDVWSTSADRIVAGMAYLGQWEQRCLDIIGELEGQGDYLYVDRLTTFVAEQTGHSSISDMFLPAMLAGDVSIIAECTADELERLASQVPSLLAQFHVVTLTPPSAGTMPEILRAYLEKVAPLLQIEPRGLRQLVEYLEFFQRDTGFPGKAFRFVDWLVQDGGYRPRPGQEGEDGGSVRTLGSAAVTQAFCKSTGLPIELVSEAYVADREAVARRLMEGVIGQDAACRTAAGVLTRFKAGLADPDRPIGSLFFVGPTGVGKTELAKQLARYMFGSADRMVRLDMSEYMLPGAAQRLLASGRGVRSLVEQVRQQPLGLVLLDEIEKAHAEVFDLLLAMLGEGRMTDVSGHLVDFRMTLVVMTSNLGVRSSGAAGFGDTRQQQAELSSAVRAHFRPEFFNRIDHVVPFGNLTPSDIAKVVDLELHKLATRSGLARRGLRLRVEPGARALLARVGWHPTRGARPLKRIIEERVMSPIAVMLAGDPKLRNRTMVVELRDTELVVRVV